VVTLRAIGSTPFRRTQKTKFAFSFLFKKMGGRKKGKKRKGNFDFASSL